MSDMRQGNWAGAQIAARSDGQVAMDIVTWHYLRAGLGNAEQVKDFIERNPDWPGMEYLREKSEEAIVEASHADVRAFFADTRPQTGTGALSLARALVAAGDRGAAEAEVVLAWRTLALSSEEQASFLAEHGDLLAPHHWARLDMALWKGWTVNARAMLTLVSDGERKLAEARLALQNDDGGVDTRIAAVPDALADDPGMAYERFAWRARKGRDADALELLLERSKNAEALGEPWAWAPRRRSLARQLMRAGETDTAYAVAAQNWLTDGSDYADLEWVAGYISLMRCVISPTTATRSTRRFRWAVPDTGGAGLSRRWATATPRRRPTATAAAIRRRSTGCSRPNAPGCRPIRPFPGRRISRPGATRPSSTARSTRRRCCCWPRARTTWRNAFSPT